jgi:hypothetical protein
MKPVFKKNNMIVNDTSRVVRMMPQHGASLTIFFLITLEMSFLLLGSSIMLLENIYSTGITNDDCQLQSSYFYSTGHRARFSTLDKGMRFHCALLSKQQNCLAYSGKLGQSSI